MIASFVVCFLLLYCARGVHYLALLHGVFLYVLSSFATIMTISVRERELLVLLTTFLRVHCEYKRNFTIKEVAPHGCHIILCKQISKLCSIHDDHHECYLAVKFVSNILKKAQAEI